jgi:prevent-host-death family protein
MAAGEFKAKCLGVMSEIASTGKPVLVTKRGEPLVEVIPPRNKKSRRGDDFIGRLEGIMEIVGDPDDLIKPVFPLEDYDMLK